MQAMVDSYMADDNEEGAGDLFLMSEQNQGVNFLQSRLLK